ncbi:CmpA/NrtA family ABC transporter substrate-binding protein [Nitratireductor sp. CH_MIT9313-5]|uniref:CmpA/NrtA family ABC transporter substrate-binding protein n=1 Tax=Nitratireductor sp. CH_MIT9313-5 TaxID=3107764 RepID=UPI0030091664
MAEIEIAAGFIPLTDSAILVAARECGFAEEEGVALTLLRETSWANIRDRMAIGQFEAAHMLAPMPIAFELGLTPLSLEVVVPMAMGLGGNAVTVSTGLFEQMMRVEAFSPPDPNGAGCALRAVIESGKRAGNSPLQFGVVHPHSGHNFELRYWLAASGINPETDVEIVIVPPPFMPDALESGRIDGYCVGEPWNSVAVTKGHGRIATVKSAIWRSSPEKVLGVRSDWARNNAHGLSRLVRALYRAAEWCGDPGNHTALSQILARPEYIGQPAKLIVRALEGAVIGNGKDNGFFEPFAHAATFPWQSQALWFYTQMVRWGQIEHTPANADRARRCYRPDLYRAALRPLSVPIPAANAKVEGALTKAEPVGATSGALTLGPDGFFDGRIFDPDKLEPYLAEDRS